MSRCQAAWIVVSALILAGCSQGRESASEHLNKAQAFYDNHDYAHARVEIRNAAKIDPRNKGIFYLSGQIEEDAGAFGAAASEYARAASLDPDDTRAQIKVIQLLVSLGAFDLAEVRSNAFLALRPDDLDALALRALVEDRQRNEEKARRDALSVLVRAPANVTAGVVLADQALRQGDFKAALDAISPALQASPKEPELLQLQARALLLGHQGDRALVVERTLVESQPRNEVFRSALAETNGQLGLINEGEHVMRDGIVLSPDNVGARLQLVGYLARFRGEAAAEAELRTAVADSPGDTRYDLVLADTLAHNHHLDEAVAVLDKASARVPSGAAHAAVRVGLAKLAVAQHDAGRAVTILDEVLQSVPNDDNALLLRGALLVQRGEVKPAMSDLLAVAGRRPTDVAPLGLLAQAYLQDGQADEAAETLKRVIHFAPDDLDAVLLLADIQRRSGRADESDTTIDEFVRRNPTSLAGLSAQLRSLIMEKNGAKAQTALAKLRGLTGSSAVAQEFDAAIKEMLEQNTEAFAAYTAILQASGAGALDRDAVNGLVRTSLPLQQGPAAVNVLAGLAAGRSGPDLAFLDRARSSLLRKLGRTSEADEALAMAVRAAPNDPAAYVQQAMILAAAQQVDQAVAILDAGQKAGAAQEPILTAKGEIEEKAGRIDEAMTAYRTILKSDPRSILAANNLAGLLADREPQSRSELLALSVLLQKGAWTNNPDLVDTVAWVAHRLGDDKKALTLLKKIDAAHVSNPQIRYHLGAIMIGLGEKDAGREIIKATLAQRFSGDREARALIQ